MNTVKYLPQTGVHICLSDCLDRRNDSTKHVQRVTGHPVLVIQVLHAEWQSAQLLTNRQQHCFTSVLHYVTLLVSARARLISDPGICVRVPLSRCDNTHCHTTRACRARPSELQHAIRISHSSFLYAGQTYFSNQHLTKEGPSHLKEPSSESYYHCSG